MCAQRKEQDERDEFAFAPPPIGPEPSWITNTFADDKWTYLENYGLLRTLDFTKVPKPFRITCKMYLWALEYATDTQISRMGVRAASVFCQYFHDFRHLAIECERRGLERLSDLSPDAVVEVFCLRLRSIGVDSTLKSTTYGRLFSGFRKMHLLGPNGFAIIPDGLCVELPERLVPPEVKVAKTSSTPLMPEAVAVKLLNAAITFVEHGPDIVLLARLSKEVSAEFANGYTRFDWREELLEVRLDVIARAGMKDQVEAAIERLQPLAHLCEDAERRRVGATPPPPNYKRSLDLLGARRVDVLIRHANAASFCVIAGFTGFRVGEILTMRRGDIFTSGARTIVRTRITKTTDTSSGVVIDRTGPSILHDAFGLVSQLSELYGRDDDRAWITLQGKLCEEQTINDNLKRFLRLHVGIHDWNISPHQFRRYFAIFFIRRFQGAGDALRRHFRHVTYRMIETYISDADGARYFLEASKQYAHQIMHDLVYGVGDYTSRYKGAVHQTLIECRAKNLPPEIIAKMITKLINEQYQEVRATYWGVCIAQKGRTEGAVCGRQDGLLDAREMFPTNCGRCKFLAVGREHLSFWSHTKKMLQQVDAAKNAPPLLRRCMREGIAVADDVLQHPHAGMLVDG